MRDHRADFRRDQFPAGEVIAQRGLNYLDERTVGDGPLGFIGGTDQRLEAATLRAGDQLPDETRFADARRTFDEQHTAASERQLIKARVDELALRLTADQRRNSHCRVQRGPLERDIGSFPLRFDAVAQSARLWGWRYAQFAGQRVHADCKLSQRAIALPLLREDGHEAAIDRKSVV